MVYRQDGTFLLLKRRNARFWQSVSGSLEAGERPVDTARRELTEETGLVVDSLRLHDEYCRHLFPLPTSMLKRYPAGVTHNLEHVFSYRAHDHEAVRLSEEHSAFKWLNSGAAMATTWSWANRSAIRSLSARVFKAA